MQADLKAQMKLPIVDGGPVDAFCGYFDVTFGGSEQNPAGEDQHSRQAAARAHTYSTLCLQHPQTLYSNQQQVDLMCA